VYTLTDCALVATTKLVSWWQMDINTWYPAGHNGWCEVNLTPEQFSFRVNQPVSQELDFQSACDYTAKKLHSDWNDRPLYLSLSGGLDSELVANTFVRNQIPFVPVIIKIGTLNVNESWYAEYWCYTNKINPIVKNLTIADYEEVVKKYLHSPLRHTQQLGIIGNFYTADFVQESGGYLLTGLGDINQTDDRFYCNTVDFNFDIFLPGQHPTGFFMYTPELVLSYINQFDSTINEQYNKLKFYNVLPRPKDDWTRKVFDSSERMRSIYNIWLKNVPGAQPHWFGNKQDVINILKGIQ
jgi:hypothetical protein